MLIETKFVDLKKLANLTFKKLTSGCGMETAAPQSLDQGNLILSATSIISADVMRCRVEKVAGERAAGIFIIGVEPLNHELHAYLASTRLKQRNKLCAALARSLTHAAQANRR